MTARIASAGLRELPQPVGTGLAHVSLLPRRSGQEGRADALQQIMRVVHSNWGPVSPYFHATCC